MIALTPPLAVYFAGLGIGAATDFWTGRLPNWLTFSMMALGIAMWTSLGDPLFAVKGIALAFAIHFPLFALNVERAGDAKLVMGAAAFVGPMQALDLSVWLAVIYLPVGLGILIVRGRLGNLKQVAAKLANRGKPGADDVEIKLTTLRTGPLILLAGIAAAFTDVLILGTLSPGG